VIASVGNTSPILIASVGRVAPSSTPKMDRLVKKLELEQVESLLCNDDAKATVIKTKAQGELEAILWKSDVFSPTYSAQVRCKQVSARFAEYNKLLKAGKALYLTHGVLNGQPVICVTTQKDGACGAGIAKFDGLLFTLAPVQRAEAPKTVEKLVAFFEAAKSQKTQEPLEQ
jgi:hypothetical protein